MLDPIRHHPKDGFFRHKRSTSESRERNQSRRSPAFVRVARAVRAQARGKLAKLWKRPSHPATLVKTAAKAETSDKPAQP